jgi:hypothetical protein
MIVDPIRHLTDILALGGIFAAAYLIAWFVYRISLKQRPSSPVPEPAESADAMETAGRATAGNTAASTAKADDRDDRTAA